MSGGGSARVPIPDNVRKIIDDIREITGKQHTDEEIYSVLKDCLMDPNETAQKLLYLDTFHVVRRKRDKKKEDSRLKPGGQGRGGRGASWGYSSNFSDVGSRGGRNGAIRRENGVNPAAERTHEPSTQSVVQKAKTNPESHATRVPAVVTHDAKIQANGKSGHGSADQSLVASVTSVPKSNGTCNGENVQPQAAAAVAASSSILTSNSVTKQGELPSISDKLHISAAVSGVSSSSDPVLDVKSRDPGAGVAISREVGSHRTSAGANHVEGNNVGDSPPSKIENSVNSTSKKKSPYKSNGVENNRLSEPSQSSVNGSLRPSSSSGSQPPPANVSEVSTSEACVQSSTELRQPVTFPNHFQVPKALKSGLTFGSFDTVGPREIPGSGTGGGENNTSPALESPIGDGKDAISRDQSASSNTQGGNVDFHHSPAYLIEKTPAASDGNSITSTESNGGHQTQELLLAPEGHPVPNVQSAQNYGLNLMSTMLGTQQAQFEGTEPQPQEASRFNNFVSASSPAVPSPSQTPPLQSTIPVSSQSVSMFRPPYPPNFFPYGPYYPPFYMSPLHQYLGHNGFPQQPSAGGNMYLPPAAAAAAAAGIKFPLPPQFKAGANTGNTAHMGIPSGSFMSPPVGYTPSPTANTATSAGSEDLSMPHLKENQIYTTVQQSEGSGVWIPAAPGQDISNLQANSLYNLAPQGQHLPFPLPQAGHGAAFTGIYPPGQTGASPSTLLQHSQALAGPVETAGLPSGSYHQPQPAHTNWNSNF